MTIDRDEWVRQRFEGELLERVRAVVTPELVVEHAADPVGRHSADLQQVLGFFRRGPVPGKYVVVADEPFARYRIGVLSGERGAPISVLDTEYPDETSVLHAIFLHRLHDIGVRT